MSAGLFMNKIERWYRVWAIAAMVIVVAVAPLPQELYRSIFTSSVLGQVASGAVALIVGGFYFLMFLECGLGKDLAYRWRWMVFFVLVPIVSSFVYFFVTRSRSYIEYVRRKKVAAT